MNQPALAISASQINGVYLDAYLAPFAAWLERDDITEIIVNRPGEVWLEVAGAASMRRLEAPEVDDEKLRRLAEQVARVSHQGINRERPLLAATLPNGARIQFIAPPATRRHWAMSIRRHRIVDLPLSAYVPSAHRLQEAKAPPMYRPEEDPIAFLRRAVQACSTILISGGTSSGKTTFLNALLREVPRHERVILVEDTPEIQLSCGNGLGLVAVKGELGEAKVTTDDLVQAAMRMRPDRIVLGELRGHEAVSFLRAINTGHPGSFTTIHANTPQSALEQLALMIMQAKLGLSRADILAYARSLIDVIVQLERRNGQRTIVEIVLTKTSAPEQLRSN